MSDTSAPDAGATTPAAPADTAPAQAPATVLDTPLVAPEPEPAADSVPGAEPDKKPDDAATKPEEPKKDEPPALKPEDYVVELPEGLTREDPILASFLEGAARGGMDNESVQAVIAAVGPKMMEQIRAPYEQWIATNNAWKDEIKADPELGGEKLLTHTIPTIQQAINIHVPEAVRAPLFEALHVTGAGNHPAIVRALYALSSKLTEVAAKPVQANSPASGRNAAAALYPSAKANP